MRIAFYYLAVINLFAFCICLSDKRRAKKQKQRVRERTLFLLALAGGSLGLWIGMYLVRHKTKHKKFTIGVPLILILQVAAIAWLHLF